MISSSQSNGTWILKILFQGFELPATCYSSGSCHTSLFVLSRTIYAPTIIFQSTQFLVFDADHVPDLAALRQKVEADPDVFMAFTSPSGNGLKIVVQLDTAVTDQSTYKELYAAKVEEYERRFNVLLDGRVNDPARATFLSHDTDLYLNLDSTPVCVTKDARVFLLVLVL